MKIALRDLGLAVIDDDQLDETHSKLAAIIGQWSSEQARIEVSPVAKALRSTAGNLSDASRVLRGLQKGIRSELEIAVAFRVTNLLSLDPTLGSRSAEELLSSFCAEADRIAHVCLVALKDLPEAPGVRGRRAHDWYDTFAKLLLRIANQAGVKPSLRKDRHTGVRSGWLLDAAEALEMFLDPFMRSPSSEARGKRLERSLARMRRQNSFGP